MNKPDERLPSELAGLGAPARAQLLEFLRASGRQHVPPTEVEGELCQSLLLKETLGTASRQ